MNNLGTFITLRPQSLLRQLSSCYDTTCITASNNLVTWLIYLDRGRITYATHSIEPFERIERHLNRLSHEIPHISHEVHVQLRLIFEPELYNQCSEYDRVSSEQPPDYQAIYWLINQGYLDHTQATLLIQELVKEVIESFLLIKTGTYELSDAQVEVREICRLDVEKVIECCQIQLHNWQSFSPYISSPYQRPYVLSTNTLPSKKFPDLQTNLINKMKGLSLRHLAEITNQDELELAKKLYPYIIKGGIILHEPDPPFDKLPHTGEKFSAIPTHQKILLNRKTVDTAVTVSKNLTHFDADVSTSDLPGISVPPREQEPVISNNINIPSQRITAATLTPKKLYKIVSVDDSPTILKEISRFLENENFNVVAINEPLKAVMSIIRHKPDLILLDLNMAGIDGYELCRIIRNNPIFQHTPIIFVTGYKGIVDKVKARFVGASGYLTKPFTQAELLKIIFKHLN
ncbi:MAG: response regulator [Nostoc sp. LLA-1]|nr:response regulator [Cyanocohniella sp. LLY]